MRALTHLQWLESESIHIMREVVAETARPVMLYSMGKDSSVMLQLARKAFFPAPPPFPLLHIDTTWKFREMYAMRDRVAGQAGVRLIVHRNPEAEALGINPFVHGSALHTDQWKTRGLKQALDAHGFDAAFGGARRDEEQSRAKERIFSFRDARHQWDPAMHPTVPCEVIMMNGTVGCMACTVSKSTMPVIPSMRMSVRTMSGRAAAIMASARSALGASDTLKPCVRSLSVRARSNSASSSTIRTWLMAGGGRCASRRDARSSKARRGVWRSPNRTAIERAFCRMRHHGR